MKNILFDALLILAFGLAANVANAQTAADETAVKTFWKDTWSAFDSGDIEKMWAAYTENAAEIGPDGSLTSGKKALRENWDAFMKMVDATPKFSYANPSVRFVTADVAVITWDSEADIKIGGQQAGGKTKGVAVVHKISGKWMIEFDSLTPVMAPPPATGH